MGSSSLGCLNDLLMYSVVAPALGLVGALAFASDDPVLVLGAVGFGLAVFGLYLLATWGE